MKTQKSQNRMSFVALAVVCSVLAGASSAMAAKSLNTNRLNPEKNLIENADGDFVGNRPSGEVTKVLIPVTPFQGDSGLSVKTNLTINREEGLMKLSVVGERGVNRQLTCEVFTVTNESATLYASKAKRGGENEHGGTRRDTVIRADCVDQSKKAAKAYVSFDEESYTVMLNDDSLNHAGPRFDIVIGPMVEKKKK